MITTYHPNAYAEVFHAGELAEIRTLSMADRSTDPARIVDEYQRTVAEAIRIANAEIVRFYKPDPLDHRCLRMAIKYGVF